MINPLKRKNEIWYEINLFEKDIAETFQQIIPDSNKNKKILNYPVDKSLKQPFALYFLHLNYLVPSQNIWHKLLHIILIMY